MMQSIRYALISLILLSSLLQLIKSNEESSNSLTFIVEIEHSFNGGNSFKPRSKYSVLASGSGKTLATDLEAEKNGIFESDMEEFKILMNNCINGLDGLYRIRIHSDPNDYNSPYVSASVPSCDLMKSGFKEDMILHLDNNNHIVGVGYSSPVISSSISKKCDTKLVKIPSMLRTRLRVIESTSAQIVPVMAVGNKPFYLGNIDLGSEVETKPQQPQQSFLRKYWYVVLIMAYYALSSNGEAPKAGATTEVKKE